MDRPIFSSIRKIKDPFGYHKVRVYNDEQIIKYILSLRVKAQAKRQDSLYLVCGLEGSGKSMFTLLAYHLYCELKNETADVNNVTRNVDELMARYAKLQRNAFITLDEAQELASDRWNEKKSKEIKEKFTIMRERAFISMICYPNPLKVNIYFREDRIRGVFFIKNPGCAFYYANSPQNTHFADILDTWDKYNKIRSLKKFVRYSPDFIVYYPEYVGELRVAYDKRKDENITKVLDRNVEYEPKPEGYVTASDAGRIMGVTPQTIDRYLKKGILHYYPHGVRQYIRKEDIDKILLEKLKSFRHVVGNDANIKKGVSD